jgi:hypothetical protein
MLGLRPNIKRGLLQYYIVIFKPITGLLFVSRQANVNCPRYLSILTKESAFHNEFGTLLTPSLQIHNFSGILWVTGSVTPV